MFLSQSSLIKKEANFFLSIQDNVMLSIGEAVMAVRAMVNLLRGQGLENEEILPDLF